MTEDDRYYDLTVRAMREGLTEEEESERRRLWAERHPIDVMSETDPTGCSRAAWKAALRESVLAYQKIERTKPDDDS